jgi:hypothetical protein
MKKKVVYILTTVITVLSLIVYLLSSCTITTDVSRSKSDSPISVQPATAVVHGVTLSKDSIKLDSLSL